MSRHKSMPTPAELDRNYPYQMAIEQDEWFRAHFLEMGKVSRELGAPVQTSATGHDGIWYCIYLFPGEVARDTFMARYKGEIFNPKDRTRKAWAKWNKPDA